MSFIQEPSVIFLTMIITLTCGIFIWFATPKSELTHSRQVRYFASFFFFMSFGWYLMLVRARAGTDLNIFVTNLTTYLSFFLLYNGFRVRVGKKEVPLLVVTFSVLLIAAVKLWFLGGPEDFVIRIFVTMVAIMILAVSIILLVKDDIDSKGKLATIFSFILAITIVVSGVISFVLGLKISYEIMVYSYCVFYVTLFGSISSLMLSDEVIKHHNEAITDELTGLHNRRFFIEQGNKLLSSARRHDFPMTLILCDIDKFKLINDRYGHSTGDLAIKSITNVLNQSVRQEDILARFGGEEFIALLPQTPLEGGLEVAERMRKLTEEISFKRGKTELDMTASFGVAAFGEGDLETNIIRVDKALYKAKKNGRNRVERAE